MKLLKAIVLGICLMSVFASCITRKTYTYLQSPTPTSDSTFLPTQRSTYLVRPGDILYISVLCQDLDAVEVFNIEGVRSSNGAIISSQSNNINPYITGYIVSEEGYISMPIIGKVQVQGSSMASIDETLTAKISKYIKDVEVKVRLYSFKITVLGDVKNPGVQSVQAERFTFLEALGNANDLTDYGDRKNIELLRSTPNGYVSYKIDITDKNFIKSPLFYMAPNDIIYVRPVKAKMARINFALVGYITAGLSGIFILSSIMNKF